MTKELSRHYLHGDAKEGAKNEFYCRSCDTFEKEEHFREEHPAQNNFEIFLRSQRSWKKTQKLGTKHSRPPKVMNLFE